VGLFSRLGRRSSTGSTPGEIPAPNPSVVAVDNGRGTLAGGVLAADRGLLTYGVGGPHTVTMQSPYPGPQDQVGVGFSPGSTQGVATGPMSDSAASPANPPYPSYDPAGPLSGRGRLSGGAHASESGELSRGPGELVNLRYLPLDPRVVDPRTFSKPVPELQPYRAGRQIISYYIDPQRQWGTSPMFNGAHGSIRRTPYVSPPPNSQTPQGSANPTVYRPTPLPWDAGVLRGTPA
jgi:hypothetical protein